MTKVAVYGSLRQGMGNHRILDGAELVGQYDVVMRAKMISLGGFPGLLKDDDFSPVTIEVYEVNDCILDRLDRLEGHPTFYKREETGTPAGGAWIYWLQGDRLVQEVVEHGDWKRYKEVA